MNYKNLLVVFMIIFNVAEAKGRVVSGRSVLEYLKQQCAELDGKWGHKIYGGEGCECSYDKMRSRDGKDSLCAGGVYRSPALRDRQIREKQNPVPVRQGCAEAGGNYTEAADNCDCGSGKTYDIYNRECISLAEAAKPAAERWRADCGKIGGTWKNDVFGAGRDCECSNSLRINPDTKYIVCRKFAVLLPWDDTDDSLYNRNTTANDFTPQDAGADASELTDDEKDFWAEFNKLTEAFFRKIQELNSAK